MNPADPNFLSALRELYLGALGPLVALAIPAARMLGVFILLPLFTRLGITGLIRGGVALALALPFAAGLPGMSDISGMGGVPLTLLLVKETMIGVLIGLVAGIPFWIAEAAGELIDQQRGSESALLPDPSGTQEAGITGTLLVLTSATVFMSAGGLRVLQEGVFQSYAVWPAAALLPTFSPNAAFLTLQTLDSLMAGGLILASPLLVAMLLTEFSLGLISRFAPQLNVFDLAMAVKGIVYVVGLPIYAIVLVGYLRDGLSPLGYLAQQLRGFAG